jgi:lysyl-tRNA synthetase class 2
MLDCAGLLAAAAEAAGARQLTFRERIASPMLEPERMAVAEAFERFAEIDLLQTISGREVDADRLAASAREAGVRVAEDDSWADVFSRILVERIEPNLGIGRATILYEYPIAQAGWARPCPADTRVAERFELYACGVELANAFGELTDVAEQRRRFEHEMDLKARLYGERYPIDEDFLEALARMPHASGIALGFDRLVMLLTGASNIRQVLWTP